MVEGGMTCVKYLLFAFNFLFFLIGLILIIAGAVIEGYFRDYFEIAGSEFNAVAVLLVVVGIIIFVIGFFGCCGAWKQNLCMIRTFAGLLVLIFVLELAGGIAGFVLRGKVEDVLSKGLEASIDEYQKANITRQAWDDMQSDLQCCGVHDYKDWAQQFTPPQLYPKSCCSDERKPGCGEMPALAYPDGCLIKMEAFFSHNLIWIGVIGIVVALIQIVGIVFACCLARSVSNEYNVV